MLTCCEAAIRKVHADFGTGLREFNGKAGGVHVLVDYPPKVAVSALVNSLKGVSARRLRSEVTGRVNRASMCGHFWPPVLLRRVLRRCAAEHHPLAHRAAGPGPQGRGLRPDSRSSRTAAADSRPFEELFRGGAERSNRPFCVNQKKSLIAAAAASLAVSGLRPQAASIVRSRL
jgi:hypothetical protein